jgi:uncharacterized protein YndB with AHSA1/START domain
MADPMEDVTAVERTEWFGVTPEALWDAITDPELLEEWFGPVDFDLTAGGAVTETDADGAPLTIGVVETVAAPTRLGFVWIAPGSNAPSSVELVIEDDGTDDDGSVLRVRETLIEPHWETRPEWFASPPRAAARV